MVSQPHQDAKWQSRDCHSGTAALPWAAFGSTDPWKTM